MSAPDKLPQYNPIQIEECTGPALFVMWNHPFCLALPFVGGKNAKLVRELIGNRNSYHVATVARSANALVTVSDSLELTRA